MVDPFYVFSITTYIVRPSPADPEAGLCPATQFSEREERLHLFCGTRMVTSSTQDHRLLAWDTRFPQRSFELHNPGLAAGQVRLTIVKDCPNPDVLLAEPPSYSDYVVRPVHHRNSARDLWVVCCA
jgi:hypothetical protein